MNRSLPTWAVGLMVGTSLDGIDAALVEVQGDGQVDLKGFVTRPLPPKLVDRLRAAAEGEPLTATQWAGLDLDVALAHEDATRGVAAGALQRGQLGFVAAHGVTVRHAPGGPDGHTLQVLDGAALAARLGVSVVCDFRRADVALGGQGAPLAPLADLALRGRPDRDRVILNLGGIANLTAIPAAATRTDQLRAGDVGPANLILDELCRRHHSHPFDQDGALALAGHADSDLLGELLAQAWVRRRLPRSFGREEFGRTWTDAFERRADLSLPDRLATLVELEARAVAIFLDELCGPWRQAAGHPIDFLVTGGGRHNAAMMLALARHLPSAEVRGIEQAGISADAKEAVDFAWLGWCALRGIASVTGPITGAARPVVLGRIHPGGGGS